MKRLMMLLAALPALVVASAPAGAEAAAPTAAGGVWPLAPRPPVVRGFEPPPRPWQSGHRGVDLLGSPGQPVRASARGTVAFAGTLAGRGVVVVSHGSTRTTYEPVLPSVRAGDRVTAGARVGTLSGAAGHCPPRACLHWGLLRDDRYLDPLSTLGAAPVRLLPVGDDRIRAAQAPARTAGTGPASAGPDGREPVREGTPPRAGPAGSSHASRAVVGIAAIATMAAGLLIRRH